MNENARRGVEFIYVLFDGFDPVQRHKGRDEVSGPSVFSSVEQHLLDR